MSVILEDFHGIMLPSTQAKFEGISDIRRLRYAENLITKIESAVGKYREHEFPVSTDDVIIEKFDDNIILTMSAESLNNMIDLVVEFKFNSDGSKVLYSQSDYSSTVVEIKVPSTYYLASIANLHEFVTRDAAHRVMIHELSHWIDVNTECYANNMRYGKVVESENMFNLKYAYDALLDEKLSFRMGAMLSSHTELNAHIVQYIHDVLLNVVGDTQIDVKKKYSYMFNPKIYANDSWMRLKKRLYVFHEALNKVLAEISTKGVTKNDIGDVIGNAIIEWLESKQSDREKWHRIDPVTLMEASHGLVSHDSFRYEYRCNPEFRNLIEKYRTMNNSGFSHYL